MKWEKLVSFMFKKRSCFFLLDIFDYIEFHNKFLHTSWRRWQIYINFTKIWKVTLTVLQLLYTENNCIICERNKFHDSVDRIKLNCIILFYLQYNIEIKIQPGFIIFILYFKSYLNRLKWNSWNISVHLKMLGCSDLIVPTFCVFWYYEYSVDFQTFSPICLS